MSPCFHCWLAGIGLPSFKTPQPFGSLLDECQFGRALATQLPERLPATTAGFLFMSTPQPGLEEYKYSLQCKRQKFEGSPRQRERERPSRLNVSYFRSKGLSHLSHVVSSSAMLRLELQAVPHSRPGRCSLRQIRSQGPCRSCRHLPGVKAVGAVGLVAVARATCRVARAARKEYEESWRRRKNSPLIMCYVAVGIVYAVYVYVMFIHVYR